MRLGHLVKLFSLLLVLMLFGLPIAYAADGLDPGQVIREAPRLIIPGDRWMQVFKAGEKVSLNVPIENTTSGTAKNVQVSLVVGDISKFPFKSEKMTFTQYISSITDGTAIASFNLTVPANTKPGVYPLSVSISYDADTGGGGQTSGTLYVEVVNDYRQPNVNLMNVRLPDERLPAGKSTLVSLVLNNEGDLPVKDVAVSLTGFNSGLTLDNWSDTQKLGQMKAREIKPVSFQIRVDPETKNGTYILDLNITCQDDYDQEYKTSSKVYLPVAGKGSQGDLTPRIIIDNYDYGGGDYATAGQTFTLYISLTNTSEETAVRNVKMSLNSDGQVFVPVGSGSTRFIREIGPGEQAESTINLKPKENAETQTYSITADIEFQDSDGNKLNEKEVISIPVMQAIKFLVTDPVTPPQVFASSPANISVDFYNTGRAAIRNLQIHTTGDFEVKDGYLYLGTLESGKSDYYDVTVIPNQAGELLGKITFEYDDDGGQHYQTEKEFKLLAGEPMPMPNPGEMQPPAPNPDKFAFKWWMIPGPLILVGVIAFIIYRRKKKAKEASFLDE